ncbi:MAG: hypothetical protein EBY17_05230 [Acidobacteriia bacterium]|nr:hypothetical protein [Terriglobia bacterium]
MTLTSLFLTLVSLMQPVPNAVATFDGVFKVSNGKFIEVQMESGETLRMYLTRGTKFVRDGKPTKAATFHEGDKVTVDAERDVRFNLLAVKLEAVKKEPEKPK